ncbi:hypothetical protein ABEB36_012098 [Hypothenemus hampei]|uniref:Uncharacterized protein n=1 Tax=Hypothenemus hampei TaxID=57062 RepID=A0ABD1EA19_HYPHA
MKIQFFSNKLKITHEGEILCNSILILDNCGFPVPDYTLKPNRDECKINARLTHKAFCSAGSRPFFLFKHPLVNGLNFFER